MNLTVIISKIRIYKNRKIRLKSKKTLTIIIKSEYNDYNNKVTKVIVINKSGFTIPIKNGSKSRWYRKLYHLNFLDGAKNERK